MRRILVLTALLLCLVSFAHGQNYEGYADAEDLVDNWYQSFLHRSARTDSGSYSWANQLRAGAAPNAVLAGILSSDEYYAKGGSTPEGFIRNLYADIVVRQPTAGELQYWMQRALTQDISNPDTRRDIAYDILTTNPGSAQWSYIAPPAVAVPVPVAPPPVVRIDRDRARERERERERDRERHQYDYHHPHYPFKH